MKKLFCLLFLFFVCNLVTYGQIEFKDICRIQDNRIIFKLDYRWNSELRTKIGKQFDLDSILLEKVYAGQTEIFYDSIYWNVKKINNFTLELSKSIDNIFNEKKFQENNSFLKNYLMFKDYEVESPVEVFGINTFKYYKSLNYENNIATFFLKGYLSAKKVRISGTFNNWSTLQNPMQKTDSGWIATINLKPGKYLYKFIIDGKWTLDENNELIENSNVNDFNSVVYIPNYTFTLKGYYNARKVILAGGFNNWNTEALKMQKKSDNWELSLYLPDGTHEYKFIVDNNWITDPQNANRRNDGRGNINSFIHIGTEIVFQLNGYTTAKKVNLVGNFNAWDNNSILMEKNNNAWVVKYTLPKGNYEYYFLVDGKKILDPVNRYISGYQGAENSVLVVEPNHIFELKGFEGARNVVVAGTFNGWNKDGYRMVKENNKWIFPVNLKKGKILYKFIVDGRWIIDPDNPYFENNEHQTYNSIIWMN